MYDSFGLNPEMIREHRGREQTLFTNGVHETTGQGFSAVTSALVVDQLNGLLPASDSSTDQRS